MKKNLLCLAVLLVGLPAVAFSQKGSISGRLVDHETLEPISGIPVVVYGTTFGAVSDKNGQFSIEKLRPENTEFIVSGNTLAGEGEEYYPMSIRNIPIDRRQPGIDLGDIRMIKKSAVNPGPQYIQIYGSSLPYGFEDGGDRNIAGLMVLIDFYKRVPRSAETIPVPPDTVETFFTHRYPDGANGLRKYLATRLTYPEDAVQNGIVGLSLASCTIDKEGSVQNAAIINPLFPSIDWDIIRLIKSTSGKWTRIEKDTLETCYIQVFFVLSGLNYNTGKLVDYNVLDEVQVTAMGIRFDDSSKYTDDQLAIHLNESLQAGNYKEAIWYLDEAMRRNPFNPELYQVRIMVNTKLGDRERVMEDVSKLGNFINGKSLQEVISGN